MRRGTVKVKGACKVMRVAGKMRSEIGAALGIDGEFETAFSSPAPFVGRRMNLNRACVTLQHGLSGVITRL
jgi:hypothetical protein